MKSEETLAPTPFQTVGPFFHLGCTTTRALSCLAGAEARGQRVRLTCRVFDTDETSIPDAMIEIWQADAQGKYNHPDDRQEMLADPHCTGFGRLGTDDHGVAIFETIKPGRVPGNDGTVQAPHLNISLFARGILGRFLTRIYFKGDVANDHDPILALVPQERRATLMARPQPGTEEDWQFDIRFGGPNETVFFDI